MADFNWDMINGIGELVSAAAVVISLVYLGRQVSMSNRLAQSEAWRSLFSDIACLNAAFGVNPKFDRAVVKVYQGVLTKDLDPDEISLVNSFMVSFVQVYEQLYKEVRAGILEQIALDEFTGEAIFRQPYFIENWPLFRKIFLPGFVRFMEEKFKLPVQQP